MALTKEFEWDCEIRGPHKSVQVRKATIILDDGEEISRSYSRHVLQCRQKIEGAWSDTDVSSEDESVRAVCGAVWTPEIKVAYEQSVDQQAESLAGTRRRRQWKS
jgi:hypothetical protein